MGRTLSYLGLTLLAATACLALAGVSGWVAGDTAELVPPLFMVGAACFGGGVLLILLAPVGRALRKSRCARCDTLIEPGQTYCRDHIQATINEYRDKTREGMLHRTHSR